MTLTKGQGHRSRSNGSGSAERFIYFPCIESSIVYFPLYPNLWTDDDQLAKRRSRLRDRSVSSQRSCMSEQDSPNSYMYEDVTNYGHISGSNSNDGYYQNNLPVSPDSTRFKVSKVIITQPFILYGESIRFSLSVCVWLCFQWFLSDKRSPLLVNRSSSNWELENTHISILRKIHNDSFQNKNASENKCQ